MDLDRFKQLPIMGILRGIEARIIDPLVETVISAGLQTIEITMNTPRASDLIHRMVCTAKGRLTIGAGTVLNINECHEAIDAGATFIVLPTLIEDVVQFCTKNNIPVFPGALTPQEIFNAWRAGASMVKLFPAKFFGPSYIKEIKAPFQDVQLMACGGVTLDNVQEFFENGASAVSFGASVFRKEWLQNNSFSQIKSMIRGFVDQVKSRN